MLRDDPYRTPGTRSVDERPELELLRAEARFWRSVGILGALVAATAAFALL